MDNHADQSFKSSSFPTESLSPSGESVSRFRDGCTRIKMIYFNKEYAKVFVAFIGKSQYIKVTKIFQSHMWYYKMTYENILYNTYYYIRITYITTVK